MLGLLLMVASTLGLGVLIWLESPLLFGALACCVGIGAGWVWATDEAE